VERLGREGMGAVVVAAAAAFVAAAAAFVAAAAAVGAARLTGRCVAGERTAARVVVPSRFWGQGGFGLVHGHARRVAIVVRCARCCWECCGRLAEHAGKWGALIDAAPEASQCLPGVGVGGTFPPCCGRSGEVLLVVVVAGAEEGV